MLHSKRLAVLFGGAIGDALGLPYEYQPATTIQDLTYQTIDRNIFDVREQYTQGSVSDDTEQAICILQAYLSNPKANFSAMANQFGHELLSWKKNNINGMGRHTRRVLESPGYAEDVLSVSKRVWNEHPGTANGGVMRTAVVGILRPWDIPWTAEAAATFCRATHYGPACVASAVAVSVAVACLCTGSDIDVAIAHAKTAAAAHDPASQEWFHKSLSDLQLDEGLPKIPGRPILVGHTYKTMGAGFWALQECKENKNFRHLLQQIYSAGGDTDTNGAVAGALTGAFLDFDQIPKYFIDGLTVKTKLYQLYAALCTHQ
jgi:ADP-ribosylglycohydrolase